MCLDRKWNLKCIFCFLPFVQWSGHSILTLFCLQSAMAHSLAIVSWAFFNLLTHFKSKNIENIVCIHLTYWIGLFYQSKCKIRKTINLPSNTDSSEEYLFSFPNLLLLMGCNNREECFDCSWLWFDGITLLWSSFNVLFSYDFRDPILFPIARSNDWSYLWLMK